MPTRDPAQVDHAPLFRWRRPRLRLRGPLCCSHISVSGCMPRTGQVMCRLGRRMQDGVAGAGGSGSGGGQEKRQFAASSLPD